MNTRKRNNPKAFHNYLVNGTRDVEPGHKK